MQADPEAGGASRASRSLRDAKLEMRSRIIACRNAIAPGVHAVESTRIAAAIAALPSFAQAGTVLLTLPFGSEWDVRPLALRALAEGKTLAIPRVDASSRMLALHAVSDLRRDIVAGFRAIPEPLASLPQLAAGMVEWVLVPGVAFDRRCHRLGYGGGYYDRLLPLMRPEVPRIAGAFDCQIVEQAPSAPHDQPVDRVVTPTQTLQAPGPHR